MLSIYIFETDGLIKFYFNYMHCITNFHVKKISFLNRLQFHLITIILRSNIRDQLTLLQLDTGPHFTKFRKKTPHFYLLATLS